MSTGGSCGEPANTTTSELQIARAWDAVVVLDYLAGTERSKHHQLMDIVANEENSGRKILVSRLCTAEVAYFGPDRLSAEAECAIVDFFNSDTVLIAELTEEIAATARRLVREFRFDGADAVHVATAIEHGVSIVETFDCRMLTRGGEMKAAGEYDTIVTKPSFSGQSMLPINP